MQDKKELKSAKTILCYGDSNTHGAKPIDFDLLEKVFVSSEYRYERQKRWTYILQSKLGSDYYVIEEGLNGRTTVFDDPLEGAHKNGLKYLIPCLESHAPIDLVILMLGTNDLKPRFSVCAYEIAFGLGVLINAIQNSNCGPGGSSPKILVLVPPPLSAKSNLAGFLGGDSVEKSKKLAGYYKKVANLYGCSFLDVGKIIKVSQIDGVHFDEHSLEILGLKVAEQVKKIFSE